MIFYSKWIGLLGVVALVVTLVVFVVTVFAQTAPTNTVLLSNYDQDDGTGEQTIFSYTYAQVFRTPPTGTFTLSKVIIETARQLNVDLGMTIYTVNAEGSPTSTEVARKSITYVGAAGKREVTLDSPITLTANTEYAVRFFNDFTNERFPRVGSTGNALKHASSSSLDDDSQPGWVFTRMVRELVGTWETWDGSRFFRMQLVGTPVAGIAIREPDDAPAKEKEIQAFINISETMDTGFPKYKEITGSDCGSSTDTTSFTAYTSGSKITLNSESSNTKKYCFVASYDTGTQVAALSGAIAGIDRTGPVFGTPTLTGTTMTVTATDANTHSTNTVTIRYTKITPTDTTTPCSATQTSDSATVYPSAGISVHPVDDDGDYFCFRAEDTAGNVSYKASATIDIPFTLTVADDTDGSDPEQQKEITVTVTSTTGVTNTVWGLVDAAADCSSSSDSSLTTSYTASTSGTTVQVSSESDNTKFACFKATFGGADYYQASGAIAGIDTTAPSVTATGPANTDPAQSKTITATDDDSGTTTMVYVKVSNTTCDNTVDFSSATSYTEGSTVTLSDETADNGKRLCFRSTDEAGNAGYDISELIDGIDTTAPTIAITNPSNTPAQSKTVTATDDDGGTTTMVYVEVSDSNCDSTDFTGSPTNYTEGSDIDFTTEDDNGKRICFRSTDAAGNVGYKISNAIAGIDRTNPTISVTNPVADGYLNATEDNTALTVSGTVTDKSVSGQSISVTLTRTTGGAASTAAVTSTLTLDSGDVYDWSVSFSTTELDKIKDDTAVAGNTIRVDTAFTDQAGNAGSDQSQTFTYDTRAPAITVTGPANTNPARTKEVDAEDDDLGSGTTTMVYVKVANTKTSCVAGDFTGSPAGYIETDILILNAETDNNKKICFRSTDTAGNIGYGISGLINGIDRTDPVISVTNPVADGYLNATEDNTALTVSGTVTDKSVSGQSISVTLTRTTGGAASTAAVTSTLTLDSGDVYDWSVSFSTTELDKIKDDTAVAGNTIRVDTAFTDQAGNAGSDQSQTFTYDTHIPDAPTGLDLKTANDSCADVNTDGTCDYGTKTDNITSSRVLPVDMTLSSDNIDNETSITLSGDISGPSNYLDSPDPVTPAGTSYTYTYTLGNSAADGAYDISFSITDAAGNVSPASTSLVVTLDTTAPSAPAAPTLPAGDDTGASDSDRLTNKTNVTMGMGTIPANECYILLVDKGTGLNPVGTTCDTGAYTSDVNTALNHGRGRTFGIQSYDAAGNNTGRGNNTNTTYVRFDHRANGGGFDFLGDDTGWDTVDNITSDTTPTLVFAFFEYYTDTKLGNSFAADVALDVYRWVDSNTNGSWTDSELTLLYSVANTGSDGEDETTVSTPFAEGVHRIVTKATDDAGNIAWTSAANVAYNPTTGVRGDNVIIIDTTEPAAPGEPDLNPTDDTFGTYPNRAKNGNDYDDITYDRSHDYFVDAAVRDSDDTADLTGHAKIMEQHHLHLYTYDGAAELVFDDTNPSTGTTFPSSPSRHDGHLFTEAVTGLTNYYESNKTTARTTAVQGELAQYDGSLWVYIGDLTPLATNPGARTVTNVTTADQFGRTAADTLSRTGKRFSKTFPTQSDTKRDVLIIATQTDAAGNVSAYSDAKIVVIDEDVPDRPTEDLFFHQGWDTGDSDTDKATSSLSPLFFITDVVRDGQTRAIIPDIDYYEIWRAEEDDDNNFGVPKYPSSATQPEQGSYNNPGDCNDGESQVDCRTRIQNLLINGGVPNPTYLDTYDNGVAVLIEAMSIMNLNRDYQFRMRAIDTAGNTSPAGDPNIITILSSPPKPVAPDLQTASDSARDNLSGGGTDDITNQTTLSFDGSYSNLGAPEFAGKTSLPTFDVTKADYADGDAVVHLGSDGIQRAYLIEEDFTAAGATELLAKGTEVSAAQSVARVVTTFVPPTGSGLSATTVENSVSATTISAPTNANKGNGDYTYTATVNLIDVYGPTVPDGVWTVSSRAYNGAGEEGAPSDVFTFTLDRTAPTPQGTETDDIELHVHLVYTGVNKESLVQRFFLRHVTNEGIVEVYADEDGRVKLLTVLESEFTGSDSYNSISRTNTNRSETFDYFVKYTDRAGNSTDIIPMPNEAKPPLVTSYDIGNQDFQIIALPYGDNTIRLIQKNSTSLSISDGRITCYFQDFRGAGSVDIDTDMDGIADAAERVGRTEGNNNELCVRAIDSSGNATYLRVRDESTSLIANIRLGAVVDNTPDYTDDTGQKNDDFVTADATPRITATTIPGVTGTIEYFRAKDGDGNVLKVDPQDQNSADRDFDNATLTEVTIDSHVDESGRLNLPALSTLQDGEYRMRASVIISGSSTAIIVPFPNLRVDTVAPIPQGTGIDDIALHAHLVYNAVTKESLFQRFFLKSVANKGVVEVYADETGTTKLLDVREVANTDNHAYNSIDRTNTNRSETFDYFVKYSDLAGNSTEIIPMPNDAKPPFVMSYRTTGVNYQIIALPYGTSTITNMQKDPTTLSVDDGKIVCDASRFAGSPTDIDADNDGIADATETVERTGNKGNNKNDLCVRAIDSNGNTTYLRVRDESIEIIDNVRLGAVENNIPDYSDDTGRKNDDLVTSDSTPRITGTTIPGITGTIEYFRFRGSDWEILKVDPQDQNSADRDFDNTTLTEITIDSYVDESGRLNLPALQTLQDGRYKMRAEVTIPGSPLAVTIPIPGFSIDTTPPTGAILADGTPTFAGLCPTRGDIDGNGTCDIIPVRQIAFSGTTIDDPGATRGTDQFIITLYHNGTAIATDTIAKGDNSWKFTNDDVTDKRAYEDGEHTFTVTATDIAGNEGPQSRPSTLTIDETSPQVVIFKTSGAGSDTARTFVVIANDRITDTSIGKSTSTVADKADCSRRYFAGHTTTSTLNSESAGANEEYCYEAIDRAGNRSYAHTSTATVGFSDIAVDQDTGTSDSDRITSDTTLTLSDITAENREVQLYTKASGESTWIRLFEGQTITSGSDGSVSVTLPTLAEGSHDIGSRIDVHGDGTFLPSEPALAGTIVIDTTAPSVSSINYGASWVDTANNTFSYTLNLSEGGTLSYTGACSDFESTTVASGAPTITSGTIPEGKYQGCTIIITDTAGNRSQPLDLRTIRTEDIVFEGPILTSDSGANADLNSDGIRDNQDRHTNTETASFSITYEEGDIRTSPLTSCSYAVSATDSAPSDNDDYTTFACSEGTTSFDVNLREWGNYVFVKVTDSTPITVTQRVYVFLDPANPLVTLVDADKTLPVTEGSLFTYSTALPTDGISITDAQTGVVAHSVTHPITVGVHEGQFSATDRVGNSATTTTRFAVLPTGLPLTETAVFTQDGPVDILNTGTATHTLFVDTENDAYFHLSAPTIPTYIHNDAHEITVTTAAIDPTTEITVCFNRDGLPSRTNSVNVLINGTKQNSTITKRGAHYCFTDDFAGGTTTVAMGGRKSGGVRAGGGGGGLGFTDFFFPQQQQEQQPTQTIIEPVITQEDTEQQQQKQQTLTRAITQGERSQYVLEAQQILNEKTDCKVATDGAGSQGQETTYLGTRTQQALRCFQQAAGLPVTGILTPATYQALISLTGQAVQVQPIQPTNNQPLYLQPSNQDPLPINPTLNRQPSLTQQQQVASFEESVLTGAVAFGTRSQYVLEAQQILNTATVCQVATSGAGSRGQETNYLGSRTRQALRCFQDLNNLQPTGTLTQETYETLVSLTPISSVQAIEETAPEEPQPQYFPDADNQDPIPINPTVPLGPQFSTLGV